MTDTIVLPPTPEIMRVTELLSHTIARFLEVRDRIPRWGKYESDTESLNQMYLMIRNVEAVITLARQDLVSLPAAMVTARSAFEMAIHIRWMLDPVDPFEREVRWLIHLQNEEESRDRIIKVLDQIGVDATDYRRIRDGIQAFREAVTAELPGPYKLYKKLPDVRAMLRDIGQENQYLMYAELSQFTHGTHMATQIYRKNLGIDIELGEFISVHDWYIIFFACKESLFASGLKILERLGGNPALFLTGEFIAEVNKATDRIRKATI